MSKMARDLQPYTVVLMCIVIVGDDDATSGVTYVAHVRGNAPADAEQIAIAELLSRAARYRLRREQIQTMAIFIGHHDDLYALRRRGFDA